jgi:hypothetical protein
MPAEICARLPGRLRVRWNTPRSRRESQNGACRQRSCGNNKPPARSLAPVRGCLPTVDRGEPMVDGGRASTMKCSPAHSTACHRCGTPTAYRTARDRRK